MRNRTDILYYYTMAGDLMARKIRYTGFSLALLTAVSVVVGVFAQDEGDPILAFYCRRAAETFGTRDPLQTGLTFSFRAKTYYMNIGQHGEVTGLDSGITDYYYSFGELDSSHVVVKPEQSQKDVDLTFDNIFNYGYEFYFFPNDTGGDDLAIGFDTYTAEDSLPVGLAVIDRDRYFLKQLYLHYPNRQYYKRYSRSLRLLEYQGYIFADSVWQVLAKQGVFTTEFFRTETGISDIEIYR